MIKIFYLSFIFLIMITNFMFGNLIIKNYEKLEETSLDTIIKIISPKIGINRFLLGRVIMQRLASFPRQRVSFRRIFRRS